MPEAKTPCDPHARCAIRGRPLSLSLPLRTVNIITERLGFSPDARPKVDLGTHEYVDLTEPHLTWGFVWWAIEDLNL